jgi:hypothetical protein
MKYIPISDEELKSVFIPRNMNTVEFEMLLVEQVKRANALAEAVNAWDYHEGPWSGVAEALAAYLGEGE